MNATFLDEKRQAAAAGDGLLRHRRHAHRRRRDRAEPRRARHHLAGRDRAVRRGRLPDRLRPQRRRCASAADALHDELDGAGIDVMLDDRGERPGAMFADWELIGVPHRVVISDRGLKEGQVEYQGRRDAAATKVPAGRGACLREGQARRMTGELSRRGRGAAGARRGGGRWSAAAAGPRVARAGAQIEEPLADSVRSALVGGDRRRARRRSRASPTSTRAWPTCAGSAR